MAEAKLVLTDALVTEALRRAKAQERTQETQARQSRDHAQDQSRRPSGELRAAAQNEVE